MKKAYLLFVFFLSLITLVQGQTVAYHENYELPSLDDSVTYTSSPTTGYIWNINTRLHHGTSSLRSDSCQVKAGTTIYQITNVFSTVGNTFVTLSFSQICKIDFLDIATIEVSNNGGSTWTQLTGQHYTGTGQYAGNGNRFASNSYGNLWAPSNASATPLNTWWRTETFDISLLLANSPNCKIRFKLADGGTVGPNNNKGWYLDNILVTMSPSELIPPVIVLANPILTGTVWNIGPFNIKAKITDQSGIDTAMVIYSVNNGPDDTVGMIHLTNDTMKGIIPAVNDSDQVCWRVEAIDASLAQNWARNPVNNCNSFVARAGITFPFYDNYNTNLNLWTPSYGGTNQQSTWEWGTPTYPGNNPPAPHSPPYCWDINLSSAYNNSAYCFLTSPVFDFSNAVNARLAFWINYNTEPTWDGVRVEYTLNGTTWNLLGQLDDTLGQNWYTGILSSSNQPGWAGNSEGWVKCKYKLSVLNNAIGMVRFRFVFTADGAVNGDGFSIDDFSITLPSPQEIAAEAFLSPSTDCGLGNETVSISIINTGLSPITNGLTVGYKRDIASAPVIENIPNIIQPGDTLIYNFVTPVNLSTVNNDITFNLKAWATLIGDPNHDDDTIFRTVVSKYVPPAPAVSSVLIPYGTSTTLTATSTLPVTWYDQLTGGTVLGTGNTYTTPILYGTTIYYPQVVAPNGCFSPRASDTVNVGQAPPNDAAALLLVAPVTGFNLTQMQVKTRIRNYGTQAMTTFEMYYKINNSTPVMETVNLTVAPGDTMTYTFTTLANLSVYGFYNLKSWVKQSGDNNQINDTCYKTIENKMYAYCPSSAISIYDGDIGNITISNLDNGNPLPQTNNPLADKLYTDFTNLTPIYLIKGNTYTVTITQTNYMYFIEHRCKIFVDWDWSGTFQEATETAFVGGPTSSNNMTMTGQITVPLTAHEGYTRFRVVLHETNNPDDIHACGDYYYGETEDYLALISPQIPHDAGISEILTPAVAYPEGLVAQPEFTMTNYGTEPITSVEVKYQLNNDPEVSLTWTGNLASFQSANVTFPDITLPAGSHTFCAWTELQDDTNTINDNICMNITGVPVDTLPYYDNFDGTVKFSNESSTSTNWVHGIPTPTVFPDPPHSAPKLWATNLPSGSYGANALCYLTTQIFDFTQAINAKISFWYKSQTDQYGDGMQVQYSTDGGISWDILGTMPDPNGINWYNYNVYGFGPSITGNSAGWLKATYVLSEFNLVPTVRFRFVFKSDGWTQLEGFAIDDFTITIPYHKDAGVDSILTPQGQGVAYSNLAPNVRIVNYGMDTLYSLDVKYTVNGSAPTMQTWTGVLDPGESTTFQFTIPYSVPQGNYELKVYSDLPLDGDHMNDTTKIILFGIPTFPVPYKDEFNTTQTYWYETGTQWEFGSPTSTLINYSYTPPYCWKTNIDGNYFRTGSLADYLYSPMFDFTVIGYDSLIFYHWVDIYPDEGGNIQYLSTSGWKTIGWMGDPNGINWYTNNVYGWSGNGGVPGWHKSAYDLTVITDFAVPTQFRFAFTVIYDNLFNHNGWAVDNFELTSPKIHKDAGVISILQPTGQTIYGTDMVVSVRLQNFGLDTLTLIPVKYQIDGITVNASAWTGSLPPDSTVIFNLPPYPSPLQNFTICAFTDVPLDTHFGNDTTCSDLLVIPPDYDVLVTQITTPVSQTIHGDSALVKVIIKNVGLFPVTEIPVSYRVADTMIIVNETCYPATPLQPGDSISYTFSSKYSYEYLGYYYLCAHTNYAADGYHANDTLCKKLEELYTSIPEGINDPLYLSQNIPNPGDDQVQVLIRLPKAGQMTFEILNMLGQKVRSVEEKMSQGEHVLDIETHSLLPGVYYYYLIFDQKRLVRKMVISH
ncbi:MAG: GEVED domain-containing protein [Bacteroidales bacterium]